MKWQKYESIYNVIEKSLKGINSEEFSNFLHSDDFKSGNLVILDTRDFQIANKNFIRGSIIIPLKITYAIWTATLFNQNTKFILITDSGKERESIVRLARVGYENVIGYLEGGIEEYIKFKKEDIVSINTPSNDEIKKLINDNTVSILDVREKGELENSGKIKNAITYPLSNLISQIEELKSLNKPIGIYCKTGGRASVAGSILVKNNIDSKNLYLLGGFDTLIGLGLISEK